MKLSPSDTIKRLIATGDLKDFSIDEEIEQKLDEAAQKLFETAQGANVPIVIIMNKALITTEKEGGYEVALGIDRLRTFREEDGDNKCPGLIDCIDALLEDSRLQELIMARVMAKSILGSTLVGGLMDMLGKDKPEEEEDSEE